MKLVESFLASVWEFVVGDDWRTALGVVLALALTAVVATTAVTAWWIMPPSVVGLLALSIRRAARQALRHD
jgi:predicted branched-subunit amino acid permease